MGDEIIIEVENNNQTMDEDDLEKRMTFNSDLPDSVHHSFKKIIIIGESGAGKSTCLNMLYNKNRLLKAAPFLVGLNVDPITEKVCAIINNDQEIIYIDTPGVNQDNSDLNKLCTMIKPLLDYSALGIDLIILCIVQKRQVLNHKYIFGLSETIFGSKWRNNTIVLYTDVTEKFGVWINTVPEDMIGIPFVCTNNGDLADEIENYQSMQAQFITNVHTYISRTDLNHRLYRVENWKNRFISFLRSFFPEIILPDYKRLLKDILMEPLICPICYQAIFSDHYKTLCSHKFHLGCIHDWITRSKTCPICRTIIE